MSSVLHPVGPEDKGTYWRRRLVVILALLVIVVLAALGIRALTAPDDAAAQGPTKLDPSTVATTTGPTDAPTSTPTGSGTGTPTGSGTATATGTATSGGACSDQSLRATLRTSATTYGPGKAPSLVLTVENTSQTTCTVETSSAVRLFTITDAAGAQVFSTADCQTKSDSATDELAPGATRSKTTVWSRQHSAAGCPTGQTAVPAGNYTVNASWDGVAAEPVTFALTD
ncbi:hypothetical protein [Kineococcus sp. SYSU DK002]|uniref:hypothetical protein n=1 Tax=Kineococcus sp. SYSU DK002 TaxID=3383123 RepID=UPI003D7EF5BD